MTPLLAVVGPTASGKSALAIEIAKRFKGEIICADSRTVYVDMDIGTAKPSKSEQSEVRHYLLDVVKPDQSFTAADFQILAKQTIENIGKNGKLPILVGGSGLYVDSVLFNYVFASKHAARDPINPRHLDKSVSQIKSPIRTNSLILGINPPLDILKQRITQRVDKMVEQGFVTEVRDLYAQYGIDIKALQAPGYKAFRDYIENKISLDEAKARFVRNDYLLARRQRTWFKRNKSIHWINNREEAVDLVTTYLNKIQ